MVLQPAATEVEFPKAARRPASAQPLQIRFVEIYFRGHFDFLCRSKIHRSAGHGKSRLVDLWPEAATGRATSVKIRSQDVNIPEYRFRRGPERHLDGGAHRVGFPSPPLASSSSSLAPPALSPPSPALSAAYPPLCCMIILDDDQDQVPKLPDPIYAPPVNRCSTPTSTSSLPDYDTSEAQQQTKSWLRRPKGRYWKIVVIILLVYTLLTVVIGVPLIVVKLRNSKPNSYQTTPWNPQQASVVVIPGQEIISSPPTYEEAMHCDQWFTVDKKDHDLLTSVATYNMPLDEGIFLGSNGSYRADAVSSSISGTLQVDINQEPSISDIQIDVTMSYSSTDVRNRTHVCLVDAYDNNGFYLYVPNNLTDRDILKFDITMLFPQHVGNVSSFAVMLPLFQQHYAALSPQITFDQVVLGGPMSNVTSVTADKLFVMASPGSITGTFGSSNQLVLETMSAEVTANISMNISGDVSQPSIRINTGNKPLTTNITLQSPKPNWTGKWAKPPQVYIDVNTFNAPLVVTVVQSPPPPSSVMPLPIFVHAGNNLGLTAVSMDSNYQGTFLAQTEYALATVQDGPADEGGIVSNLTSTYSYQPRSVKDSFGRTLYYDSVSDSSVTGWIGQGQRPKVITTAGSPGCVEAVSVLSPVQLDLAS
ncbi:hypothetical protein EIP91_010787 [Steccherinum ochraceum]|uniref:Uncharacterized protein n=1 Tax=Steccherinum ochraceum TaxID=92696 RepID=A0A4R0R833_9APHY|nr:hypothetical protein EIP91_010787 [Steccherinum ochraceum]